MSRIQPTEEKWQESLHSYRAAGWEGEDPGDFERMFWEAGFKQGVTAVVDDLRKWSRPLGQSPEDDVMRLVLSHLGYASADVENRRDDRG